MTDSSAAASEIPLLCYCISPRSITDAAELVVTAIDAGYRHLDVVSAPERAADVGRGLRRRPEVPRDQIFVSAGRAEIRDLLSAMQLDHLDLYVVEWVGEAAFETAWTRAIAGLERGLVKLVGVRGLDRGQVEGLIAGDVLPAVHQAEINPFHQQRELVALHERLGIVTEAVKPMADWRRLLALPDVLEIANAHGRTESQVVIRWHMQSRRIALTSPVHAERIVSNADVFDFELTSSELERLNCLEGMQ